MKALSIGRDQACDIVIGDSTDVVSRRHAVLNISSTGKMTIVDQSRNGTYVNGIRISPNVPVPVSRKDIISFAHVAKLDWNAVPASNGGMRYALIGGLAALLVVCVALGYKYIPWGGDEPPVTENVTAADTAVKDTPKVEAPKEVESKNDSNSLSPEKKEEKPAKDNKKEEKSKDKKDKSKGEVKDKKPSAPADTVTDKRPIG